MKTYKIEVEETVIATYWVDADSEEQAKTLWQNGNSWTGTDTQPNKNDEIILIEEYELETTND